MAFRRAGISLVLLSAVALPGCPGPTDEAPGDSDHDAGQDAGFPVGSGTLTGELAFPVSTTRSAFTHYLADGGRGLDLMYVTMASANVDVCDENAQPPRMQLLSVGIGTGDGSAVGPGSYSVDNRSPPSPDGGVAIIRATWDPDLGPSVIAGEATGAITLDAVSFSNSRGSFSVQFIREDGGTSALSGTFDASGCPL